MTLSPGKFYVERGYDPTVRVPQHVLKGVAFIGEVVHRDSQGKAEGDLHATGFFVYRKSAVFPHLRYAYIVTAKHVAEDLKDREIYILVNDRFGGVTQLKSIGPHWCFHPTDETADIAVRQVAEQQDVDLFAASLDECITPEGIKNGVAAIGDEIFVTGLFSPAPGQKRNMPIVRHGNISMIPEEQIQTELGFADVYLVEGRSIGGLSGSPVFVRRTITLDVKMYDGSFTTFNGAGPFKLLGAMHGHWDIKESEINKPQIVHNPKQGVNLGIAIVVPAIKIIETVDRPELAHLRKLGDEDLARKTKSVPGMDSAKTKEPKLDFTQEDFENALKKASRKVTPEK